MADDPTCARCGRAVGRHRSDYEVFERMHWACFHYEFEHFDGAGDPDVACADPSCPARSFDPAPQPSWLGDADEGGRGVDAALWFRTPLSRANVLGLVKAAEAGLASVNERWSGYAVGSIGLLRDWLRDVSTQRFEDE